MKQKKLNLRYSILWLSRKYNWNLHSMLISNIDRSQILLNIMFGHSSFDCYNCENLISISDLFLRKKVCIGDMHDTLWFFHVSNRWHHHTVEIFLTTQQSWSDVMIQCGSQFSHQMSFLLWATASSSETTLSISRGLYVLFPFQQTLYYSFLVHECSLLWIL